MYAKKKILFLLPLICLLFYILSLVPPPNKINNFNNQQSNLVALGHLLFFDTKLSINGTKACASCHDPQLAFTDGYRKSLGAYADLHQHNSPSLLNLSSYSSLNWSNPYLHSLKEQMKKPLFNTNPIELGMNQKDTLILMQLKNEPIYKKVLNKILNANNSFNWELVFTAIEAYIQQIESRNSAFDNYNNGNLSALNQQQLAGKQLFFSKQLQCGTCHGGKDLNTSIDQNNFHNIGLYAQYPEADKGIAQYTKKNSDIGKFRTPSLRNVAITAPYMHNGSVATLNECIAIFERGGQYIAYGNLKGDGKLNPHKSPIIKGFTITKEQQQNLIAFLYALTDTTYLQNPLFKNPF